MSIFLNDEIEKCFKENPNLVNKNLKEIAAFFMIQGQVRYSLLRATLNNKADFFYCRLADIDEQAAKKAMQEWLEAVNVNGGLNKDFDES